MDFTVEFAACSLKTPALSSLELCSGAVPRGLLTGCVPALVASCEMRWVDMIYAEFLSGTIVRIQWIGSYALCQY